MPELRAKLTRFFVANGRTAVLIGVCVLAVTAVGAFFLGQQTFSALKSDKSGAATSAQLLRQDAVASIAKQDTDKDGLTDLEEVRYGTDPKNKDTDHDGFPDDLEVKNGYDPLSTAGKGVDESKANPTPTSNVSLLGKLGLAPVSSKVDGLNVGGVGGLGGLSEAELKALSDKSMPADQRLASLEVDKLLTSTSTPLPPIDPKSLKVRKNADRGDLETFIQQAFKIIQSNNPFPAGYKIQTFLDDVSTGNTAQLQQVKLSLEVIDRQLSALEVPDLALTVDVHTLGIVRAGSSALQELLAKQNDPDATLKFTGRTVFLWNEIRALIKEVNQLLKS